jgi:hypothetical protein
MYVLPRLQACKLAAHTLHHYEMEGRWAASKHFRGMFQEKAADELLALEQQVTYLAFQSVMCCRRIFSKVEQRRDVLLVPQQGFLQV